MTKERKAKVVTFVVLFAAVGAGVARKIGARAAERGEPAPQDAIYAMLDAARAGDVSAYVESYTAPMQAAVRQAVAETTEPAFAKYLRDTNASIKGVAVYDPEKIADSEAKVRVEYVYQDRNEVQTMYLEKGPRGWKISRADGDERVKTLIPYGTPVK